MADLNSRRKYSSLKDSVCSRSNDKDTSFFEDGKRRIDAILVYETSSIESLHWQLMRDTFRTNLMADKGLETELALSTNPEKKLFFLKIHVPCKQLVEHAKTFDIKPTVDDNPQHILQSSWWYRWLPLSVPKLDPCDEYLKAIYREEVDEGLFAKDHLFTTADRALIVWEIMWRTRFGPGKEQIGILKLLQERVFETAYPLHDGHIKPWLNPLATHREVLYREWGSPRAWFKHQPLNIVCIYFGHEVAIYFAWLSFYNRMLLIPTIIGIGTFIFGMNTIHGSNSFVDELCSSQDYMCAKCPDPEHCSVYRLSNSCSNAKFGHIADNDMTIVFAIVMTIWATTFHECWKRRLEILRWYWNLHDTTTDNDIRPQYEAEATEVRYNPLINKYYMETTLWSKSWRMGLSIFLLVLATLASCAVYFGIIILKAVLNTSMHLSGSYFLSHNSTLIANNIAGFLNLAAILSLTHFSGHLSKVLTNLENPRTRTEYDKSYTLKRYVFSFVNYYSALIYVAFIKGRFFTYPGDNIMWRKGYSMEQCDPAGCLSELSINLAIIMCGKQFVITLVETISPKISRWRKRRRIENIKRLPQWEVEYTLEANGQFTVCEEVHEMVLQYGFVTLFVSAFPLAPLFALINNIFEVRIDAQKMLCDMRRPFPRRVTGLGAWDDIILCLTYLAVVFNGLVIGFTSDFVPKLLYKIDYGNLEGYVNSSLSVFATKDYYTDVEVTETICRYEGYRYPPHHPQSYQHTPRHWLILCCRFMFVVIFEHTVFGITILLAYAIPDMPRTIKEKIREDEENKCSERLQAPVKNPNNH